MPTPRQLLVHQSLMVLFIAVSLALWPRQWPGTTNFPPSGPAMLGSFYCARCSKSRLYWHSPEGKRLPRPGYVTPGTWERAVKQNRHSALTVMFIAPRISNPLYYKMLWPTASLVLWSFEHRLTHLTDKLITASHNSIKLNKPACQSIYVYWLKPTWKGKLFLPVLKITHSTFQSNKTLCSNKVGKQ